MIWLMHFIEHEEGRRDHALPLLYANGRKGNTPVVALTRASALLVTWTTLTALRRMAARVPTSMPWAASTRIEGRREGEGAEDQPS